jgi:hypothetical protein
MPAYAMVAGVPAKIMGWMSAYRDVLEFDAEGLAVDSQGVKYQKFSAGVCTKISLIERVVRRGGENFGGSAPEVLAERFRLCVAESN